MRKVARAVRRRYGLAARRVAVRTHVACVLARIVHGSGVEFRYWAGVVDV